ncbi:MAG: type IV pilin [Candidatus Ratteibacteria bacterium]|nr:type IV pilin [Candidatus Ratteibacteria bacterium]
MSPNKSLKNINRNDSGVSPIIAVLLLLVLTVAVSTSVLMFGLSFKLPAKSPMSVIIAENGLITSGEKNIQITHKGGDSLSEQSWSLSIVPNGNQPSFKKMNTGFSVGEVIFSAIKTDGSGNYGIQNGRLTSSTVTAGFRSGETIHVLIRDNPSQNIIMDRLVTIR